MRVSGQGLSVDAPKGWHARLHERDGASRLHIATYELLASDGDYGAAATGRMRHGDCFAALVEYVDPVRIKPNVGLYAPQRPPTPQLAEFSPNALQVTRIGQLGWQRFFTEADRTCCLYAVIKPGAEREAKQVKRLAKVLATLTVAAR